MKYMVVSLEVRDTAPGIVFKSLLNEMADTTTEIHLLTPAADKQFLKPDIRVIDARSYSAGWDRSERSWRRYGFNKYDMKWVSLVLLKNLRRLRAEKYDAVVTFVSNGYYASLDLSYMLSRLLNLKWLIYSVDALPCTEPWYEASMSSYRNIWKHIRKVCGKADCFLSSNEYMMHFQQSVMEDYKGRWGVVYTPWTPLARPFNVQKHEGYTFLYAGSLYGLRRIDGLVEAFREFVGKHPDANLVFVGDCKDSYKNLCKDLTEEGKVKFLPYSNDIQSYYEKADVLLDIAADIPDDVYISSKIISYLPIHLPIIAISGANSPVRSLMNTPSIFHAYNRKDEILNAMENAMACNSFDDREKLVELCSTATLARNVKQYLSEL